MNDFFFECFVFDREQDFNTLVKVSRHPVSTSHIDLLKAIVVEIEYSAVLKEVTYDRTDGDIIAYSFYSCFKTAYSTDDKVDFNSGGRCFIKRSYYARVTEGIHLSFDKCFFARFYKFCFSVYHFGKSVTKPDRCYGKFVPCGWF